MRSAGARGQAERLGDVEPVDDVVAERARGPAARRLPGVVDVAPEQIDQFGLAPAAGGRTSVPVGVTG